MLVVGIDPGVATTGYGFVRQTPGGSLETTGFGVILTPPHLPLERRLLELYQRIKELLFLHQPDSGAVEKLFFQKNVSTAMIVGQARGVIMLALAEAGLAVAEYSPLEVKQAITGFGGAKKGQMQLMVKALLDLEDVPRPDDAADALAVGICHLNTNQLMRLVQ